MPKSLSPISSQLFSLIERIQSISLDAEISEKLDRVQELVGNLYLSAERNIKAIAADYSFLSSDHVFLDGDDDKLT